MGLKSVLSSPKMDKFVEGASQFAQNASDNLKNTNQGESGFSAAASGVKSGLGNIDWTKIKSFGDFAGSFSNAFSTVGGSIGANVMTGVADHFTKNEKWKSTSDEKAARSIGYGLLNAIPGVGNAIALAAGAVDAIGTATGTNLSSIDKETANRAGVKGRMFNKIMNYLPGNSAIWGGLSRLGGNDRTNNIDVSDDVLTMSNGFSSAVKDLRAADSLSDRQLFFGQTKTANAFIDAQQNRNDMMQNIFTVNTQRKESDYYQDVANQNINRFAGRNYLSSYKGKNGMKLMSIDEARQLIAMRKELEPEKLQNGGNIPGITQSILPEGHLHARKNHLAELNPDLEDATKKGIPVMASENGEIDQQVAEIEHSEWIMTLELTQRIEALAKDGSEEAMIEAGKLIANELIENTVDNVEMITEDTNE